MRSMRGCCGRCWSEGDSLLMLRTPGWSGRFFFWGVGCGVWVSWARGAGPLLKVGFYALPAGGNLTSHSAVEKRFFCLCKEKSPKESTPQAARPARCALRVRSRFGNSSTAHPVLAKNAALPVRRPSGFTRTARRTSWGPGKLKSRTPQCKAKRKRQRPSAVSRQPSTANREPRTAHEHIQSQCLRQLAAGTRELAGCEQQAVMTAPPQEPKYCPQLFSF